MASPSEIFDIPLVKCPRCGKLSPPSFLYKFGCTYCNGKNTFQNWKRMMTKIGEDRVINHEHT